MPSSSPRIRRIALAAALVAVLVVGVGIGIGISLDGNSSDAEAVASDMTSSSTTAARRSTTTTVAPATTISTTAPAVPEPVRGPVPDAVVAPLPVVTAPPDPRRCLTGQVHVGGFSWGPGQYDKEVAVSGTATNGTNAPINFYGARVGFLTAEYPGKVMDEADLHPTYNRLEPGESVDISGTNFLGAGTLVDVIAQPGSQYGVTWQLADESAWRRC